MQRSAPPNPAAPLGTGLYDPLSTLDNLRWVPYAVTCGALDELVPFTGCQAQAGRLEADGLQLFEAAYPTEDHLVFATQNDFTPTDTALGSPALDRKADPGSFSYTWYPDESTGPGGVDGIGSAGQVGPTGAYWLSGLTGASTTAGTTAGVVAASAAIPDPAVAYTDTSTPEPQARPTPYVANSQTWQQGNTPVPAQTVTLQLANVRTATIDAVGAGLGCGALTATTDGPLTLTLARLRPGSAVTDGGSAVATADGAGVAMVDVAQGTTTLGLCSATSSAAPVAATPEAPLALGIPLAAAVTGYGVWRLRSRRRPARAA